MIGQLSGYNTYTPYSMSPISGISGYRSNINPISGITGYGNSMGIAGIGPENETYKVLKNPNESKVKSAGKLCEAMELAFEHDVKVIIEEAVQSPIEVECAVLGNDELMVGGPGEIVPADEFYSYDAKYYNDESETFIKARIEDSVAEEIRETAEKAYKILGCKGLTRVDFLIDGDSGKIVLNEPNTLPGFTNISMYPKLIMSTGMTYSELIDKLLELACE